MTSLDFDSLGQAPEYALSKALPPIWREDLHIRDEHGRFHRSLIARVLEADASDWRHLDLSHEAWREEFPNNRVETPIGTLRLGENQIQKLIERYREHYFGLIKPTLTAPTFIVEDKESEEKTAQRLANGEPVERDSVLKFIRAFWRDGSIKAFCCVSMKRDGLEIVISASERKLNQVAGDVQSCIILRGSTLATQAGIVGREDGAAEPVLKAILDTLPMFVKGIDVGLKRASAPDSLHKSSHSTVQGAATGDGLYTCIVGDAFVHVNHASQPDYDSLCKSAVYAAGQISPLNFEEPDSLAKATPTEAQLKAGNYPKRKVPWHGMTISIENEAGSVRRGVDPKGKAWETQMLFAYGYLNRTEAVDGDHVDVYLGPVEDAPMVYVVHQRKAGDWGRYDEDKVFVNFSSEAEAVDAFLKHYNDFRFLGPVTAMPVAEFVAKARATFDKPAMIKAMPPDWDDPEEWHGHVRPRANGHRARCGATRMCSRCQLEAELLSSHTMIKSSPSAFLNVRWLDDSGLDFGQDMLAKSEHGPIPEGAHWITVNSGGGKGNPILVMPHEDGSMRVIGGAGGALNHLKLRSVKTGEGYKESIAAKQQARQEKQKAQTVADKAAGIHESKGLEKGKLKQAMKQQREEFVNTVAEAMGWTDHQFDDSKMDGLSPEAQAKARKEHDTDLFKRAKEAVGVNRKMLLNDHDALAASGLGDVPLQAKAADTISVDDLDPVSDKAPGLGFAASYGDRAEKQGLTPEAVEKELTDVHGVQKDPVKAEKTASKKVEAENIGKELEAFKDANPETHKPAVKVLTDAKKAAALVLAHKKLKMAEQMARHASMELANAKIIESKAYVLEASDAEVEEGARKQMEQDIKTIGAAGLLSEIDKMGGEESLGGHVGAGAFNSLNAFATAVGGEPLIDRSVVDVLGINAAAQVLARRIASDYQSGDYDAIKQGVEDYHTGSQAEKQEAAVSQAQALHKAASEIELPEGKDGFDLAHAQELNHQRREAVHEAKRILGQATGELQANAALVMAMRQGAKDQVEVSLGKTEAKAAITQLHALGLKSGDYKLDDVGGNLVATVNGAGLDRLAKPVDVEGMKQIKRNLAIIRGDMDEDGWLPQGFASRPDLAMKVEAGVAPKLAHPFEPGADLGASLRDYIGGRIADGGAIQDILADVQSADFFAKAGDQKAYRAALDAVAPLKGEDGKLKPIDSLKDSFEKMADDFVGSKYGPGTSPLHRQNFEVDKKSVDALHRALSDTPEGVAAFKPIGDLTPQERNGLRKWWEGNVGKKDAGADGMKADLADHEKSEPEKSSTDMFGEESVNPDWHAWKAKRDDMAGKANAAGLDWGKYVGIMGSPTAAIAATQDLVRSHVVSGFADAHNKLNPNTPLKIGKATIQGSLNHLDAVDPAARADRQAKEKELIDSLRERINGKYAGGSVADKMAAQAEANQAFEQAQMGFFSTEELGGDLFGTEEKPQTPKLGADERFTLGHAAEQKIAGMMSVVGQNFKPGKPTKLWNASMSGKYAPQQRAVKLLEANKRVMLAYGAGCVRGDVVLDDVDNRGWTFAEWWISGEAPTVWSMSKQGMVPAKASKVFAKGIAHCREIRLSDGTQFTVSDDHLLLTRRGWVRSADVQIGDAAVRPSSSWQGYVRHVPGGAGCEPQYLGKVANSLDGCQPGPHLCDGQLQSVLNNGQSFSPSQVCVQERGQLCLLPDAHEQEQRRIRLGELSVHHSSGGAGRPIAPRRLADDQPPQDATVSALLHGLLRESWLSDGRFAVLRNTCGQYLAPSAPSLLGHEKSPDFRSLLASCSCEQSQSKCQVHGLSQLYFEDVDASELQEQWEMLEGVPSDSILVVSVGVASDYTVFDVNVPEYSNYVAMGVLHHNSGKTGIALGATAHLIKTGAIKRALHLVPSVVQEQYGGEASRYLEAGQFKWHCQPGASQAERIAGYKDASNQFNVVTHESFRADMLHLGAQHAGISGEAMNEQVAAMSPQDRKAWAKSVMDKEGMDFGATFVDEAHQIVNRAGKENSARANVIDAVSDNTPYLAYMSGDPAKNDPSEIHDVLAKMDRERYGDRASFMRKYGGDTVGAKAGLKRELARYGISNTIPPDIKADYQNVTVPLSEHQRGAIQGIDKTMARLAAAKSSGTVDVEAAKALSPASFEGAPEDQHEVIAKGVAESAGIMKESAVKRVINSSEQGNAKIDKMLELAEKHKGQPGVVFAHNRAAVAQIIKALEAKGHKVASITGSDSAKDKASKKALFQPESGEPKADIMVCSDAAATGLNLQRGQWMVQHDVCDTAMGSGQRSARIHRLGQQNNVSVYTLMSDHKSERVAMRRLQRKFALRELMVDPMDSLDDTGVAGAISKRMLSKQSL